AAASKWNLQNFNKNDPHARCLPAGPNMIFRTLFKIVQSLTAVVLLHEEGNNTFRQILMDGRKHPNDPNHSWLGYSTGHWEDETLVVETIGFNSQDHVGRFWPPAH